MKILSIIIMSWIVLIGIQNLITIDSVRRMNKCIREQKEHYTKCEPTVRFYNYLQYNNGECIGYKLFPAGLSKRDDENLIGIACYNIFKSPENKWGY